MDKFRGVAAVALLRFLSCFPFIVLQHLGNLQGYLSFRLKSRQRCTVEANLSYCFPHWTPQQRLEFARRNLQESAKTAMEMGAIWCWPRLRTEALIREVHGQALLDVALAKKRGVILLTPHLGNWEMVGFFAAQIARVTSLYAPATLKALDRLIYEGRTRNGSTLVPTNAVGVKTLLKALKAGEIIIMLPDQVPEEGNGVFAPFFGKPALTMTLLASLAKRTGAEVLCCYAKRRGDRHGFDVYLQPTDSIDAQDEVIAVTAMNQSVERCINACPEQYQWGYKRFREREGGKLSFYGKDRRLAYRRLLRQPLAVSCVTDLRWSGHLLNLTPGGFMLATEQWLPAGSIRTVNIVHPAHAGEPITADATCIWSRAGDKPGEYWCGMWITFMPREDNLRLLALLEDIEKRPWNVIRQMAQYRARVRLPLVLLRMASRLESVMQRVRRTREYRFARENIRYAFPELDAVQQQELVNRTLQECSRMSWQWPLLRLAPDHRLPQVCPAAGLTGLAKQQGVLLLLPNLGSVEMVLHEAARRAPLTLFYQPVMSDAQDRTFYLAAIRDGYAVLHMHEGYVETALRILARGGVVAFFLHQLLPSQRPEQAPWFGDRIPTLDLFPLVSRTRADVLCAYAAPDSDGRAYEIVFSDLCEMKTARDAQACAALLSAAIERCVRERPWLYGWIHRVFPKKGRPSQG